PAPEELRSGRRRGSCRRILPVPRVPTRRKGRQRSRPVDETVGTIQFSFHASVVCNCGASLGRHPESLHYSTGRRFRTGEVESVDNLRGSEVTTSSLLWRLWRRPSAVS